MEEENQLQVRFDLTCCLSTYFERAKNPAQVYCTLELGKTHREFYSVLFVAILGMMVACWFAVVETHENSG